MTTNPSNRERALDLLAERAVAGLAPEQAQELDALLAQGVDVDADDLDLAAAAADLALADPASEPLPAGVRAKVESAAITRIDSSRPVVPTQGRLSRPDVRPVPDAIGGRHAAAWLVAAACLLLAIAGWWQRLVPQSGQQPDPDAMSRSLMAAAADVQTADWTPMDDPMAKHADGSVAKGHIVWSTAKQQGCMHFTGLTPNDPAKAQYQLWIFTDPGLEPHPIDGGVFDVPSDASGEVVVAMNPKIRVKQAVAFAVTLEPPGGVVVSDRKRLALLAKVKQ